MSDLLGQLARSPKHPMLTQSPASIRVCLALEMRLLFCLDVKVKVMVVEKEKAVGLTAERCVATRGSIRSRNFLRCIWQNQLLAALVQSLRRIEADGQNIISRMSMDRKKNIGI